MISAGGMVDFHSHILPGADHGSDSVEVSLYQLGRAEHYGVTKVIATPHFYPHKHTLDAFLNRRAEAYDRLIKSYNGGVQIRIGAEVQLCEGFERFPSIDKLFISGTNTLLLELPYTRFKDVYVDSISSMISDGIDVVLAHADRYRRGDIEALLAVGARIQLNASSVIKLVRQPHLTKWIEDKKVVALGSDIHGKDGKAYSSFAKAVNKIGKNNEYIKAESDLIWNKF